jgi:c-di-GMP-binding flagellar brake protein YcgR
MQRRGRERRRFVRVADDVRVELAAAGGRAPADSRTLNFSLGGVLVVADEPLPVGHVVQIALHPHGNGRALAFEARVVRVRTLSDHDHELALEFVGGTTGDQRALQEQIERRLGHTPHAPLTA